MDTHRTCAGVFTLSLKIGALELGATPYWNARIMESRTCIAHELSSDARFRSASHAYSYFPVPRTLAQATGLKFACENPELHSGHERRPAPGEFELNTKKKEYFPLLEDHSEDQTL